MHNLPERMLFAILQLGLLTVPNLAEAAADVSGTKMDQPKRTPGKTDEWCRKVIGLNGRPHKLSTVASLSAVRRWVQAAAKYGDDYSMWHNAQAASIKCEKFPRSDYYMCFASAKPCRSRYIDP